MPQVLAWQCPRTSKLFAAKDDYQKHLAKLARKRQDERKLARLRAVFEEKCRDMRRCSEFEQIAAWIEANVAVLAAQNEERERRRNADPVTIAEVAFAQMRWSDSCSNTHCAPLRDGVENWHRYPNLPLGYPGWHGTLTFVLRHFEAFPSTLFQDTGVFCGSGGGNGGRYRCEVTLFDADWPALRLMRKLRGDL